MKHIDVLKLVVSTESKLANKRIAKVSINLINFPAVFYGLLLSSILKSDMKLQTTTKLTICKREPPLFLRAPPFYSSSTKKV